MNSPQNKKCFTNKLYRQSKHTFYFQILFSNNHAVYEIMWKNTIQPDRPQMAIWRMHIAWCITKATNTHSEYVKLIAFPGQ
jgi:hypothetical protein